VSQAGGPAAPGLAEPSAVLCRGVRVDAPHTRRSGTRATDGQALGPVGTYHSGRTPGADEPGRGGRAGPRRRVDASGRVRPTQEPHSGASILRRIVAGGDRRDARYLDRHGRARLASGPGLAPQRAAERKQVTPERWRRITEVFHAVLARDAAMRMAFLDDACAGDEALRQKWRACWPRTVLGRDSTTVPCSTRRPRRTYSCRGSSRTTRS